MAAIVGNFLQEHLPSVWSSFAGRVTDGNRIHVQSNKYIYPGEHHKNDTSQPVLGEVDMF